MTKEDFINASVGFKGSKFFLYAAEVDGGMCTVAHGEIEDIVIAALDIIEKAAKRNSRSALSLAGVLERKESPSCGLHQE